MGADAHAVNLDDEVVADPAALVGGGELDHALMGVYLQADDLALLGDATGGDVADEEGLLALILGVGGRVVAGGLGAGVWVEPGPLLADVAEGLVGDGGLFCGHWFLF